MKYIVTPNGKFIGRQKAWALNDPPPPEPTYTDLGPFNTWTIPPRCTDCLTYFGDNTVRLYGKGGYEEVIDRSLTVDESGTYKISYDYDIPVIKYYSMYESDVMHFGIYISTVQPPQIGGDLYQYARYSRGNCNGADIVGNSAQTQYPGSGHIEYEYTLSANTTYWLWLPFGNCEDNMEMFFTFKNIRLTKV